MSEAQHYRGICERCAHGFDGGPRSATEHCSRGHYCDPDGGAVSACIDFQEAPPAFLRRVGSITDGAGLVPDGPGMWVPDELADVVTYLDLLAFRLGIDLGEATIDKFNRVSERVGSTVYMDAEGWHLREAS